MEEKNRLIGLKKIEEFMIRLLTRINIGKRLMILLLVCISLIIAIMSFGAINSFSFQLSNEARKGIETDLKAALSTLENKKKEGINTIKLLASIPDIKNILAEGDDEKLLSKLKLDSNIELRNKDFEIIATNFTGNSSGLEEDENLKKVFKGKSGFAFSFFIEENNELNINTLIGIKKGFKYLGSVTIYEKLDYSEVTEGIDNITGSVEDNELYGIQIYSEDKLVKYSRMYDMKLINDRIIQEFTENRDLEYIIENKDIEITRKEKVNLKEEVNQNINDEEDIQFSEEDFKYKTVVEKNNYLVGYMPIRDFFGKPIGYVVCLSPQMDIKIAKDIIIKDTLILAAEIIILALLLVIFVTRSITVPLNKVNEATKRIASGDLTELVVSDTKDQLAILIEHFNQMIINLRSMVGDTANSSSNVLKIAHNLSANAEEATASTEEVATTSEDIAQRTVEQANRTDKTVDIIKSIKKQAQNVTNSSIEVNCAVDGAFEKSQYGLEVMRKVTDNIKSVLSEVKNTTVEVSTLRERVEKIDQIVEAINYINEETTLLSLNAAIEAARAGEAGRGFAVVADEIRKLAEDSNRSVKEIDKVFLEINKAMKNVVESMNKSTQLVNDGGEAVKNAEEVLEEIQMAVNKVKEVTTKIHTYVEEQLLGTEDISKAIEDINKIAQVNAKGVNEVARANEEQSSIVEEMAITADELSLMADNLQKMVNKFKLSKEPKSR